MLGLVLHKLELGPRKLLAQELGLDKLGLEQGLGRLGLVLHKLELCKLELELDKLELELCRLGLGPRKLREKELCKLELDKLGLELCRLELELGFCKREPVPEFCRLELRPGRLEPELGLCRLELCKLERNKQLVRDTWLPRCT